MEKPTCKELLEVLDALEKESGCRIGKKVLSVSNGKNKPTYAISASDDTIPPFRTKKLSNALEYLFGV